MERRLQSFLPDYRLRTKLLSIDQLDLEEGFEEKLHFLPQSKQWNFFTTPDPSRFVLLLMRSTDDTASPTSDETLALVFGEVHGARMDLWHVSTNRNHPLNDSQQGRRWGMYGLERVTEGSKVRWKRPEGGKVTAHNHAKAVRGTPNPYAAIAICEAVIAFGVHEVQQNPEMPCAQLFHKDYDHTSHVAIALLYRSLGFEYRVGRYVWYDFFDSMQKRLARLLWAMSRGEDGVSE